MTAPLWIGGLALGIETGSWYIFQQNLQSAADAVADSIAGRAGTGASQTELSGLATAVLTTNRFEFSRGTSTVEINPPPQDGIFADGTTVTVRLTRSVRRQLTGFFNPGDFVLTARATAEVRRATPGCILALAQAGGGTLSVTNSANVQVTGCEVLANSVAWNGFSVVAGSSLSTDCARVTGDFAVQGQLNVSCQFGRQAGAGLTLDPYVRYPEPDLSGLTCIYNNTNFTWTGTSLQPNFGILPDGKRYYYFCNGSIFTIAKTVSLFPDSLYIFDSNAQLVIQDGVNVSFPRSSLYFRNGAFPMIWAPTSKIQFSAPSSGPRAGVIFFGARANSNVANNQIAVGPGSSFDGAIYFPASTVLFRAQGTMSGCPQIIANRVTLFGGVWMINGPCTSSGTRPIVASRSVRLTN
jgi:hypothetical protein